MHDLLQTPGSEPDWEKLQPVLDQAMHDLDETDREAILLRYFQNSQHAVIGERLGLTENAARMRIERALEKLRNHLARRGITTSATALSIVLSANAVQAAPVGLAVTISTASALVGTTVVTTATATATKAIAMTTLQKAVIGATLAAAVGTGVYEAHQNSQLRDQVKTFQQQQAPLGEQVQQLQRERDEATKRLTALREDNERLNRNTGEVLKLRGEVARLRADAELAQRQLAKVEATNKALLEKTSRSANGIRLRELLEQMPDQKIPELSLLNDAAYLDASHDCDLDTDEGIKKALSQLRFRAENLFAVQLQRALQRYTQANQQSTVPTLLDLTNYFDPPIDMTILERYQVVNTDTNIIAGWRGGWAVTQKNAVDSERDQRWSVSPVGFSPADFRWPEQKSVIIPRQKLSGPNP
jgi:hypothetical protein